MKVRPQVVPLARASKSDLYARLDYADESVGPKHRTTFDEWMQQKRLTDEEIQLALQCAVELRKGMPVEEMVQESGFRWVRQVYILEAACKLMEESGYICVLIRGKNGHPRWRKRLPGHLQVKKRKPIKREELLVANPEEKHRQVKVLRELYQRLGTTPKVSVLINELWPRVVPELGRRRVWVQWVEPGDPNEKVPMIMSHQWRRYFAAAGVPILKQLSVGLATSDTLLEGYVAARAKMEEVLRQLYQDLGRHPSDPEIFVALNGKKKINEYLMEQSVQFQIRRLYAGSYQELCVTAGIPLTELAE
jgi:hypothetical protein